MTPTLVRSLSLGFGACLFGAAPALAQDNVIPGTDVALGRLGLDSGNNALESPGHVGAFPGGAASLVMETTSCNFGTTEVPWEAPMDPDHPFIAFLIARESNGRLVQISDHSFVKHGFFALTQSICTTCQEGPFGGGDFLGLGCADTYSVNNNGDTMYLAPPLEIDPWLGLWDPVCSLFDVGPDPGPMPQCDGQRSFFGQVPNQVQHRVRVLDADLDAPGTFYYQGYYVIEGEPEAARENNLRSRRFVPSWTGSQWNVSVPQASLEPTVEGSVLERWSGATVTSGLNDGTGSLEDGRFYVAVKVTGPANGLYRYEYAVHNRDNFRGMGALRIPICPDAQVSGFGFEDVDLDGANDWTASVQGGEVVFDTPQNPLRWNSFFNFWFDSDAAPVTGVDLALDQFDPGAGAPTVTVTSTAPMSLPNPSLGPGCSFGAPPDLYPTGSPPQATLGNASFGLESTGNDAGGLGFLLLGLTDVVTPFGGGCDLYMGANLGVDVLVLSVQGDDGTGTISYPVPIPADPTLEGAHLNFQSASLRASGGPFLGSFDLTNGLRVFLGDGVPSCP